MLRNAVCVLTVACAASAARAQEPVRPALFLGQGRPLSSVSRSFAGDSLTMVGLRLPFPAATPQLAPDWGRVTMDVDWHRAGDKGSSFTSFGAYLTERIPLGRVPEGADGHRRPWFGLGFGIGQVGSRVRLKVPNSNPVRYEVISESRIRIGYKLVVGKYLSDNVFVEAGYHLPGTQLGLGPNSLLFGLGTKF